MKKLYVLVFLIMFMGKMFSSSVSSANSEVFLVPQPQVIKTDRSGSKILMGGDKYGMLLVKIELPDDYYETITSIGGVMGSEGIQKPTITQRTLKLKIKAAIEQKLNSHKDSFYELDTFFKANGTKIPTLTFSDLKDNPWNTLAPKVFAAEIGLTESDLKPSFFSKDFGKTGEEKFILNMQRQIIKKATNKSTKPETIQKLLGILKLSNDRLPVGIGKTTAELINSVSLSVPVSDPKRVNLDAFRKQMDVDSDQNSERVKGIKALKKPIQDAINQSRETRKEVNAYVISEKAAKDGSINVSPLPEKSASFRSASITKSTPTTSTPPNQQPQAQASVVRSASITTSTPRSQQQPKVSALMGGRPIARSIVAIPPKPIRKV